MRKIVTFIIIFAITLGIFSETAFAKNSVNNISADGVILMDYTTGEIIYSKNIDKPYPPASTTKIITALLTLEKCKLDDEVIVGKNPPFVDGSKIYLYEGEKLTVKDLLYALLLQSANDAAEALAEHISGSTEEFVKLMNNRAKELGALNTDFVNPHGLYDENHRTTARDLALILRELSKHPEYKEIATTNMYYIKPTNKSDKERPIWNKNRLVQKNSQNYYEGCEGGKTGYTVQSKHSYVAVASKNGQKLIAVLLHDSKYTYWTDVKVLFDYGFNNFTLDHLYLKGDLVDNYTVKSGVEIPLLAAEDFYYVKEKKSTSIPKVEIENKDLSKTSFERGDTILNGNVTLDGKKIGVIKLASGEKYSSMNFLPTLSKNSDGKQSLIGKAFLYIFSFTAASVVLLRLRKLILRKNLKNRH